MPLIGRVGRKRFRARFAMSVLYLVLSLGAVTTLYPFLLMAGTGLTGITDQNDNKIIPDFIQQDEKLLVKFTTDKFSGNESLIQSVHALEGQGPSVSLADYEAFMIELPVEYWTAGFRTAPTQVTSKLSIRYQSWLREKYGTIEAVNKAYIDENVAFQTIQPPIEQLDRVGWLPVKGQKWVDWLDFKKALPAEYRVPMTRTRIWQEFLRGKNQNQFGNLSVELKGSATKFEELKINPSAPEYPEFVKTKVPVRYQEKSFEDVWVAKFAAMRPPTKAFDAAFVTANKDAIRGEFASRNYRYIIDYIALNGRALWNTFFLCGLTILAQLIVNPIAAYAISRYPIKSTGKILIFLLATMAFPAEVAMIPSFLMLKDLGLLNTFWALVLPGMASGYMIFLLKGFFDSLPQELFESGQIDGAKESTMMMKIAFPLSRPVLGYLALLAFMGSYGAFMYAFLVTQDRKMWTLMVFIYQLQNSAPKAVMMAALTVAAIPTLLVFLAAQRVILKGIVLPGER